MVKPGGLLIYESTNVIVPPTRSDIELVAIPASAEAAKMKNTKIMNMIVLGAFLRKRPIIKFENIIEGLKQVLPERYHHLIPLNTDALNKGMELVDLASVTK
jgi:2-oxoglutarate ferredoxin oxidoreductase subunit gamma